MQKKKIVLKLKNTVQLTGVVQRFVLLIINVIHKNKKMKLPKNGVAREIRSYVGSLFIFLFVIGLIIALIQFPVLDTNKEVVMMLIGTISASIGITVATITGSKPDYIVNNIKKSGVISKNIKQTRIANKTLLGISDILTDPLQYYTDTDFIKPTDINGLDS